MREEAGVAAVVGDDGDGDDSEEGHPLLQSLEKILDCRLRDRVYWAGFFYCFDTVHVHHPKNFCFT